MSCNVGAVRVTKPPPLSPVVWDVISGKGQKWEKIKAISKLSGGSHQIRLDSLAEERRAVLGLAESFAIFPGN